MVDKYRAMLDAHSNVKIAVLGEKVSHLVSIVSLVFLIIGPNDWIAAGKAGHS